MKTQGEHIRTLRRRVDFLKAREYKNSYDQAELGALEWALVNLPPAQHERPSFAEWTSDHVRDNLHKLKPAQQEPVALKWQQAPVKTQWGDEMVVASVAIDKDHTVCLYCERDQTPKVDAMFAQRTWVDLTDEEIDKTHETKVWDARRSYARAIEAKLKEKNT